LSLLSYLPLVNDLTRGFVFIGVFMSRQVFGPASEKQKLALQDNTTDVILVGGGKSVPPR
jgi:hypothetical protein